MIEQDLRSYLLAQSTINALIVDRLYPLRLPQGATLPAVTYQRIFGAQAVSHDGASDLGRARLQLDCWADTYAVMASLADALRAALSGYRGPMGANASTGARVINILDASEPEPALWRRIVEIMLWHQEG